MSITLYFAYSNRTSECNPPGIADIVDSLVRRRITDRSRRHPMLIRRAFLDPCYSSFASLFLSFFPLSVRTSQLACEDIPRLDPFHRRDEGLVLFLADADRLCYGMGGYTGPALGDMIVVVLVIVHLRHEIWGHDDSLTPK